MCSPDMKFGSLEPATGVRCFASGLAVNTSVWARVATSCRDPSLQGCTRGGSWQSVPTPAPHRKTKWASRGVPQVYLASYECLMTGIAWSSEDPGIRRDSGAIKLIRGVTG